MITTMHALVFLSCLAFVSTMPMDSEFVAGSEMEAYPLLPIVVADPGTWPPPQKNGLYFGDVRAVVNVPTSPSSAITVKIFWRRRDKTPELKQVIVTDSKHNVMQKQNQEVAEECGLVTFYAASGPGMYYVYYLPHFQTGGGAWLHFHWYNCSQHTEACVLSASADLCTSSVSSAENVTVLELQARTAFHGPTVMDLTAVPSEVTAIMKRFQGQPFIAIAETRHRQIRMTGADSAITALWAKRQTPFNVLEDSAMIGEFWTFQIGLFAAYDDVQHVSVTASDGRGPAGTSIPSAAVNCFNLAGTDLKGKPFTKRYSLSSGHVGALWFGVDIPSNTPKGSYTFDINVTAANAGGVVVPVQVTVNVIPSPSGGAVELHGDRNVTGMSRLRWLNSQRGIDDGVTEPFIPVALKQDSPSSFSIHTLTKRVSVDNSGLPVSVESLRERYRGDQRIEESTQLLSSPVTMHVADTDGRVLPFTPSTSPRPNHTDAGVYWSTLLENTESGLQMSVEGNLEFDSIGEFRVTMTATHTDVDVSDIRLSVPLNKSTASYIVGMGIQGSDYTDIEWRWQQNAPDNTLWVGRPEAGVWLRLKGQGDEWNNPNDGKDFPSIPFIPTSWGGASATPGTTGVNVSAADVVAFSGPRTIKAGTTVTFLFDLAFTPSHPVNMTKHWQERYYQVGYGCGYASPQQVAAMGASVVTLHQGTPGIVNGSMVNPHINYPFLDDTVPFLTNYTRQANQLGMATKFYYTIRELSNYAYELFALMSLQGEVILDQDPYTIPQPGYCQDWDCHGGAAWLHEHVVTNYTACWQQNLANGEWDAALCDTGVGRWFNYYVEGLYWSMSQPPFINGVYYDGIGFDRHSMRRIRKAADSAAKSVGQGRPQLDVHTGRDPAPPATSYLPLFPYVDAVWNGEGFDFSQGPAYWLVEVSGQIHGLSGDRLGGGQGYDWRGMLFGMTQRNSPTAPELWKLWDASDIGATRMVGWWEVERPVELSYTCDNNTDGHILATSYIGFGRQTVVAIASWCPTNTTVTLSVDWTWLGIAPVSTAQVPAIEGLQPGGQIDLTSPLHVAGNKGVILVIE